MFALGLIVEFSCDFQPVSHANDLIRGLIKFIVFSLRRAQDRMNRLARRFQACSWIISEATSITNFTRNRRRVHAYRRQIINAIGLVER